VSAAPRVRLFVALDLPAPVRAALVRWQRERLAAEPALRVVRPEGLHVTLCFLGWRDPPEAEVLGPLVLAAAAPVSDLGLAAPAWLPPRRPRVLAIDVEDGAGDLAHLQERLSAALAAAGGYVPEARPFRPHVTVARVRDGTRPPREPPSGAPTSRFAGAAVTLYRSRPGPGGSAYEALARREI